METNKINSSEGAGRVPEIQFSYRFNRPNALENPMPDLVELVQAVVKCVGKDRFIESQKTILDQWAGDNGYLLQHDQEQNIFTFTHISLIN